MNNEDSQAVDRALRERIVSLIRANQQTAKKPITEEELQKSKAAASRLDRMLQDAADAERKALRSAASRLDQLLADIRGAKDVAKILKQK
jgi:uncharacterized protein